MKLTRKRFLSMAVACVVVFSSTPVFGASAYLDGIYQGMGEGFGGSLAVHVQIEEQKISAITVDSHGETPYFWNLAYPEIAERIIAAQSSDVDVISGATYSSNGVKTAVAAALREAEDTGTVDKAALYAFLEDAEVLKEVNYTSESWTPFAAALASALHVASSNEVTQDQVDDALVALIQTMSDLVEAPISDMTAYTLGELKSYAAEARPGQTIYLGNDIEVDGVSSATINTYEEFTIDGKGHALDGKDMDGFFYVRGGTLTLKNLTIKNAVEKRSNGSVIAGSAVYARRGNVNLENCTLINNTSSNGNVYVGSGYHLVMKHCTFADNVANNGGAVYLSSGSTGQIANSILVGSQTAAGEVSSDLYLAYSTQTQEGTLVTDGGYNLIATLINQDAAQPAFAGDTTRVDADLNGYADWLADPQLYQTSEKALPLLDVANSPAMDKIPADNSNLLATDARGVTRPQNQFGDIGAYEVEHATSVIDIETIKISANSLLILKKDEERSLSVIITPENATDQSLIWSSSNPSVLKTCPNQCGRITAVGTGTAVLKATASNGVSHSITVRVTP